MGRSHTAYCELAVKWLLRQPGACGPGCQFAASEVKISEVGEIPDAIGLRIVNTDSGSIVVEVKITRSDFLADRLKPHRQNSELGMGSFRYYMAPTGLIKQSELPDKWGLLEVSSRGTINVVCGHVNVPRSAQEQWRHERALDREWLLQAVLLSRVGDVDKLHGELKRIRNERAKLARSNDDLRQENAALKLDLYLANRPAGNATSLVAKRKIDTPQKNVDLK